MRPRWKGQKYLDLKFEINRCGNIWLEINRLGKLRKIQVATFDKSMWQAEKFEGDESAAASFATKLPQNCHALLPSLSGWSGPQWNIWTSQITPQLDVCESKWNIWTLMIAEISSLLLTHQDWWWLTYFANPICQFHISLYPLMIRGTQWWWRIWWGWWKERKNKVKEDFKFLGAGATAAPLRRKGSEEIQSFSQLSNGSDLSVNPKCLTTFLDFPFHCFVSKEKILTVQQHKINLISKSSGLKTYLCKYM